MAYLNGVHVRKVLRLRTLAVKLLGALLAVGSGLAVGPEGPLVHAGAIVGSGLTTGGKRLKRLRHRARGGCCGRCAGLLTQGVMGVPWDPFAPP